MPRKYDKYGFNRQYLRRPCTRANPFPYRIPFDNGFSTRTLLYTLATFPSTKVKPAILAPSLIGGKVVKKSIKALNPSVTRSGKEFKGQGGKRMKLSEVAAIVSEREGELGALAMKGGELTAAFVQGGIALEALYNTVHIVSKGGPRQKHRNHHHVRN